jgi:hypothetical protein
MREGGRKEGRKEGTDTEQRVTVLQLAELLKELKKLKNSKPVGEMNGWG